MVSVVISISRNTVGISNNVTHSSSSVPSLNASQGLAAQPEMIVVFLGY